MKPPTERQQRARKRKSCVLTSLKHSCGKAEPTVVEGVEVRLCDFHLHNLLAIVADAKAHDERRRRYERKAA